MPSSAGWLEGAAIGFVSAFAIQAFSGHWKLWVDSRKSVVDDLVKAIDVARTASVGYFEQAAIAAGSNNQHAREVIYSQKMVTDLFGIADRQFGPVSDPVAAAFRAFREGATGQGFLQEGTADPKRAAEIAIAAAACSTSLRDWSYAELSPSATTVTFIRRKWKKHVTSRPKSYSPSELERLTR